MTHHIDPIATIDEYIGKEDWRVNANANQDYSLGGLILNMSGKVTANYWLEKCFTDEASKAHRTGAIHIHDLDLLSGYCFTGDTRISLLDGTNPTLAELHASGRTHNFEIYAYDTDSGDIVPAVGKDLRITRHVHELTHVTLDNGETVKCTPDHKWMLRDGTYKEARDLQPGDSLMPLPHSGKGSDYKITSVSTEHSADAVAVYDFEVPHYNNFALTAGVFVHNCAGWSLRKLLEDGFNGVSGAISAKPPKHFSSACGQIVNFLGTLQNEWAGAQAFSSFDTYMAPFVRLDHMDYEEIVQNMQELIFNLNVPSRWGGQSPFTNLTFDWTVPEDLKDTRPIIGHRLMDFTYGDLQEEMNLINQAFIEVMEGGDAAGRVFTFPIPTYNITKDFDWDSPNTNRLFEMTAKYGLPYFQNFINSDLDPNMIRSMCPLTSDTPVLVRPVGADPRQAPIVDIVNEMASEGATYEVWTPNGWKDAKPVRAEASEVYTLTLSNGETVSMGANHLQPVKGKGTISGRDIEVGDWLPFTPTELPTATTTPTPSNDFVYYRVETKTNDGEQDNLYCFEVDDPSHLFTLANGLVTHNCRLQLDVRELLKRGNGLFGSAELTGSIGVVTINLARLGYLHAGDMGALMGELDRLIDVGAGVLEARRTVIQELIDKGLYPYTKHYLGTLDNHFSTLGVNGMNEMIRNFTGDAFDIGDSRGHEIAVEVLDHIRGRMVELQERTGHLYNLEATPAEGTTYRFAKEDQVSLPGIIQAGTPDQPYYTNSSQLPVGFTDDPFHALEQQEELQGKYTGGTVLHLYMGEKMNSGQAAKEMVRRALTNFKVPYITITPTFSICPVHGYLDGEHFTCEQCEVLFPGNEPQECEVWTRVMGYFRPVASFNIGKRGEYAERVPFDQAKAVVTG